MRVATTQLYATAASDMARSQSSMATLQEQISSGKRITSPADDPTGAARALELNSALSRLQQFEKNTDVLSQSLSLEESTLTNVTEVLQRVRELAIAANSGTQTTEGLRAIVVEVEQRLDELVSLGNTKNANGDYLFSGFKGHTKPFTQQGDSIVYNGDQGQSSVAVSEFATIAGVDSGYNVFANLRSGNGTFQTTASGTNTGAGIISIGKVADPLTAGPGDYSIRFTAPDTYDIYDDASGTVLQSAQPFTPGDAIAINGLEIEIQGTPDSGDSFTLTPSVQRDVFSALREFIEVGDLDPEQDPANATKVAQQMNAVLNEIDTSLNHILDQRAATGARLNVVETTVRANSASQEHLSTTLSKTQDLDYTQALSQLHLELTTLEAIQRTFTSLQSLSLFSLLR